jgi:hypothetical protein
VIGTGLKGSGTVTSERAEVKAAIMAALSIMDSLFSACLVGETLLSPGLVRLS